MDTVTDDEGGAPETPGVTTIIGIDGIPWPITVDRAIGVVLCLLGVTLLQR